MSGVFTKIVSGEIPSYKIAETEKYFSFLDINPLTAGHALVIPKREEDYVFDLEDEELSGLIVFAKKVALAIEKVIKCERIGISVIGLEVPHAHVHLIPINSLQDMNFAKSRAKISSEEFQALADRIAEQVIL